MTDKARKINCPTCQQQLLWSKDNPYRPFCSQRCQLIDFGEWAQERHSIAGESVMDDAEDPERPE